MATVESVQAEVVFGLDVGKGSHYGCAVGRSGRVVWQGVLSNDEVVLRRRLESLQRRGSVLVVVDQLAAIGALAVQVAVSLGLPVGYLPGLSMRRIADVHPGNAKTDRKDAFVIADAGRSLPHTVQLVPVADQDGAAGIAVLAGYDEDLRGQVNALSNRLHDALLHVHPALERTLAGHLQRPGVLALLTRAAAPAALSALGPDGMRDLLREGGSPRLANTLPDKITAALAAQRLVVPGTDAFAVVIAGTASALAGVLAQRGRLEDRLAEMVAAHPLGTVLTTMPAVGVRTAAGILAVAPDPTAFPDADHFISFAGLNPLTRQSGTSIRGERPNRGGHRQLRNVLWRSADIARLNHPESRQFYQRKRDQGKNHQAAMMALTRRRAKVLFALMKNNALYDPAKKVPSAA